MGISADAQVNVKAFSCLTIAVAPTSILRVCYTGYRPIFDAMKTFAAEKGEGVVDIEVTSVSDARERTWQNPL